MDSVQVLSFQFNLNVLTADFVMLMKWNPGLLWLNFVASWLNNYVYVILDYDLTYQSYIFCLFIELLFMMPKGGINWRCSDDA